MKKFHFHAFSGRWFFVSGYHKYITLSKIFLHNTLWFYGFLGVKRSIHLWGTPTVTFFLYFCICIVFVYLYFICVFVFPTLLSWDSGDHAAVSGQHPHLSSCAGGQGWKCLDLFKLPNIFSLNAKLFLTTCKMCCVTIRICPVTNCACGRSDRVGNVAQSAKKVHFYISPNVSCSVFGKSTLGRQFLHSSSFSELWLVLRGLVVASAVLLDPRSGWTRSRCLIDGLYFSGETFQFWPGSTR